MTWCQMVKREKIITKYQTVKSKIQWENNNQMSNGQKRNSMRN